MEIVPEQITSTNTKQEPSYKQLLANLAVGDADHDLGSRELHFNENIIRPVFNAGIPNSFSSISNEDTLLNSVIQDGIKATDVTTNTTTSPTILNIGYPGNTELFKYSAVHFNIKCSPNTKDNVVPYNGSTFGKDFFTNTELGGKNIFNAAFIVDFNQHGFLENFTKGNHDSEYTIHYLMTPEVVNDPAGKPNIHDKSLFSATSSGNSTGIQLFSYIQTDTSPLCYTAFNINEPNPANNFFSNYDFTLSPIKSIYTKNKAEKQITTLDIKYDDKSAKPLTDIIEDSKGENSITTVLGYLKNIISKLAGDRNNKALTFNFNSKVQQKRGGDWFQALSCLDVKSRDFTQILPTRGTSAKLQEMPVYFVTHDRIAVAYALLNGINVIYLDYYGRVYVLKNSADPTLQGSGKSIEEMLYEGIKTKWIDTTLLDTLNVAKSYNSSRSKIIRDQENEFNDVVTTVTTFFNSINENNIYKVYQKVVVNLQDIFKAAVKLMFVKINLIDISSELEIVENYYNKDTGSEAKLNLDILDPNVNKVEIRQLSRSLNIIKSIQNKYYENNVSSDDIENGKVEQGIIAWIGANISKLDVFKAAKNLLTGSGSDIKATFNETDKVPFWKRLLNFTSRASTSSASTQLVNDSLIFLPFIQTLDNINKNSILGVLNIISDVLIEADPSYGSLGANTKNIFYVRLANVIKESNDLLNNQPSTEIEIENEIPTTVVPASSSDYEIQKKVDIFFEEIKKYSLSYSTDANLVSEDLFEINTFREENGKISSGPQNDNDNTEGNVSLLTTSPITGGGYRMDGLSSSFGKSVICDVSILQITRPLLTSIILESFDVEKIRAYESINVTSLGVEAPELERPPESTETETGGGKNEVDVLKDYSLGFHPLLPIYMMMSSFYYTLGPKYEGNSFYYSYFTYFNVFETMTNVLIENYLNEKSNLPSKLGSYIIGYALKALLFTSHTSKAQNDNILEILGLNQEEYFIFSLKNSSFASLMTGAIFMDPQEEAQGIDLLNSNIFKGFINNYVNIKQILKQGTSVEKLPHYDVLKERVYKLLKRIVIKINNDRGTPENNSFLFSESSATQEEKIDVVQEEEVTSTPLSESTSDTSPKYLSSISFISPKTSSASSQDSNIVYSTTSSSSKESKGGKTKKAKGKTKGKTKKAKGKTKKAKGKAKKL